jgi:hypothetical protein
LNRNRPFRQLVLLKIPEIFSGIADWQPWGAVPDFASQGDRFTTPWPRNSCHRNDLRFLAMFRLAYCYRDGLGTQQSRDEAKRWLDRILAVAPKEKSDYRHALKLRREIDEELF